MFLSYLICVHRCYVFNKTLLMQLQLFNSENKGLAIALLVTHIFSKALSSARTVLNAPMPGVQRWYFAR